MNRILRKLCWLTQRSRKEADLREELQFHLEEEAAEIEAAGMVPEQSKWAARRDLGNVALLMEDTRTMWGWTSLELFRQDLRFALRMLRKNPGFSAAVSSVAGARDRRQYRDLQPAERRRTAPAACGRSASSSCSSPTRFRCGKPIPAAGTVGFPTRSSNVFRRNSKTLSGVFGGTGIGPHQRSGCTEHSGLAQGDAYTDNFFSVLGIAPQHGRFFSAGEDTAGASVAVVSDRYWRSRFGADPSTGRGARSPSTRFPSP